jgi:hypothetical protein
VSKVFFPLAACLLFVPQARADLRTRAATELAEALIARFGARAGRSVPALARRIEGLVARHGEEAVVAVRKVGPSAFGLVEAAGPDGARAVRVMAVYGERGAARVVSRPTAMRQFLRYGDEAAAVLVKHPGVAEPLVERGGAQAVKALAAVNPRNGRRLAMMLEGDLAQAGRHAELLGVVARHGDRAADFIWRHKGVLAGGAALAAFLANPQEFIDGVRDITAFAGESVVKPVVGGFFTLLNLVLVLLGVLIVAAAVLAYKHGLPSPATLKALAGVLRK